MSDSRPLSQPAAISATIRRLRRERGLTQEALASAIGVSPQAISKWETGQAMPDITLLLALSRELQISVNELLGGSRRQEQMEQFKHATLFGEEFILMACEDALLEFPDDEFFLKSRANALLQIGTKGIMRREEWIRMAINEYDLLSSKYPDDPEYPAKMAEGYAMLGDRERATSTMLQYSGPGKEAWMEPFLDEETRITKKQKNIKSSLVQLTEALEEYGTKDSLAAAHTLLDILAGDDKTLIRPTLWSLSMREAILCRDAGDDEGFVAHLTRAYEQARETDRAFQRKKEQISHKNPLFDRLQYDLTDMNHLACGTFLFLNDHHELFSHPAAVGLKKRILDEMVECCRLEKYMFIAYLQFCIDHINFPCYLNYSTYWDMTDEEEEALHEECRQHPLFGKYLGVVWQSINRREAERLCQDGVLKGCVATHYNDIIAYCNCKEKSKYKRLPIPAELSADAAPEGAKILAIVEMLISHDYRDCGLEEKLLDNVLSDAKRQGYTHVQAYLVEDCLPEMFEKRIRCFSNMGFEMICDTKVKRRIPAEIEYSNRRSCLLQKELQPAPPKESMTQMKKQELHNIAAQFSAYDVKFYEEKDRFDIVNPYGKEPIIVIDEGIAPNSAYVVSFSCYHVHLETADEVIAQVHDILEDKIGVIEFHKNGRIAMSTALDLQDLRELTFEALAQRLGEGGDSCMRLYADHYADSLKVRGWGKDTDFDASFIKDAQGNVSLQSSDAVILAHRGCTRNKQLLQTSQKCGCFHCLATFAPAEISDWIIERDPTGQGLSHDELSTARCPYCGIDSVIGDASGFPVTKEFLGAMQKHWFY